MFLIFFYKYLIYIYTSKELPPPPAVIAMSIKSILDDFRDKKERRVPI